jgi:tetratricopeptide (TPR) repeat protein
LVIFPFSKKVVLLITVGVGLAVFAGAQVSTQDLFMQAQFIEYIRLRNQASLQIPYGVKGQTFIRNNRSKLTVSLKGLCNIDPPLHKIWERAEIAFAFSQWLDASSMYATLIHVDSSCCDAYFRLSQCHMARNDLVAASRVLALAEKRFPAHPLLNPSFGELYILLSLPGTALYYFEREMILRPKNPEGLLGASWAAYELGENTKAMLYLKRGAELLARQIAEGSVSPLAPTIDYIYVFESLLYSKLNQNERSMDAIRQLNGVEKGDIEALRSYWVGIYYYNKGERYYPRAKRNIKKAAGTGLYIDPGILRQLGVRSDPTDFKGMVLRQNYSRVPTHPSSAKSLLLRKADTFFQNQQLAAAVQGYATCIQEDSSNIAAFERLGECYRNIGRNDDAVGIYELATRRFPKEIKFHLLLAREFLRIGETERAILTYRKAIMVDKKNYQAYYGACLALLHQGEYRKALDLWNSGKGFFPQYETVFLSGIIYFGLGYYDAAVPALSNSSLNKNPISKYYLSLSYHFMEDQEELAASNMLDAIKLGAIVNSETVKMVGLDPAVHRSY